MSPSTIGRLAAIVFLVGLAALVIVMAGAADPSRDGDGPAVGPDTAAPSEDPAPTTTTALAAASSASPVPVLGPAPPLERLDGWLQSDVTSLEQLRGRVVVVQFWTFGCINCKRTIPNLQELAAVHADDDFTIVGVHAPEFEYEADPDAIAAAAEDLGVTWPIALDTDKHNFHAWQEGNTAYWPRTYVIDRQGRIRFDHIGEGAYDDLNETVALLLAETT